MSTEPPGHGAPPNAVPGSAERLEPYGARVLLSPEDQSLDPSGFLKTFLEDVAVACVDAGASVVGHLKCFLRTGDGHLRCNLTSVKAGARCEGEGERLLPAGSEAELGLAVLVYGLPAATIDGLVGDALDKLLSPAGVYWTKDASFQGSEEGGWMESTKGSPLIGNSTGERHG
ncbi:MAG: hypothetical protein V1912_06825 [bacterium]